MRTRVLAALALPIGLELAAEHDCLPPVPEDFAGRYRAAQTSESALTRASQSRTSAGSSGPPCPG